MNYELNRTETSITVCTGFQLTGSRYTYTMDELETLLGKTGDDLMAHLRGLDGIMHTSKIEYLPLIPSNKKLHDIYRYWTNSDLRGWTPESPKMRAERHRMLQLRNVI